MMIKKCLNKVEAAEDALLEDLDGYAVNGLRTLCYCMRNVEKELHDQAQVEGADPKLIESDYILLGVSGVEDLLQNNVKSCILDFMAAKIKVWVLTGDKGSTAQNIAQSCGIIDENMLLVKVGNTSQTDIVNQLTEALNLLKDQGPASFAASSSISKPAAGKPDVDITEDDDGKKQKLDFHP